MAAALLWGGGGGLECDHAHFNGQYSTYHLRLCLVLHRNTPPTTSTTNITTPASDTHTLSPTPMKPGVGVGVGVVTTCAETTVKSKDPTLMMLWSARVVMMEEETLSEKVRRDVVKVADVSSWQVRVGVIKSKQTFTRMSLSVVWRASDTLPLLCI